MGINGPREARKREAGNRKGILIGNLRRKLGKETKWQVN
jgi:hypothetical protein